MITSLVESLSIWSGLSGADIERIIRSAPRRYKAFSIKKKNGGLRVVAQPSRELKLLQRLIVDRVLAELPVHNAAHGYVRGRGIKSNALAHSHAKYLLKMDLESFFPSIRPLDLARRLSREPKILLTLEEKRQLYSLLFWKPRGLRMQLCIGAPSSPFISNALMCDVDVAIASLAIEREVVYTRYADDMTFSCENKGVLPELQALVERVVESSRTPRLKVNDGKTVHISRAQRMVVTGVTISTSAEISLGRERKRLIRSMVHRFQRGELDLDDCWKLKGLIAFAHDIEPDFAFRMREKCKPIP
jgi:RNA-directed DNA polymerase